jgi:beta-glucosidase
MQNTCWFSREEVVGQRRRIIWMCGSVLSGGGSAPSPNAAPAEWVRMVNEIQRGALSSRLGIPVLYGMDAVHGHSNVYK